MKRWHSRRRWPSLVFRLDHRRRPGLLPPLSQKHGDMTSHSSVCPSVCPSVWTLNLIRLSVCPSVPLYVCHKNFNILSHIFWTVWDRASIFHMFVYDKRDDFGFPIVDFPWLSGDVPRLPSYGIYISQLVRFARCCASVLDFYSKNLQITSKLLTQGYRYHKLRKTFGKFFRSYSELLLTFGDIMF